MPIAHPAAAAMSSDPGLVSALSASPPHHFNEGAHDETSQALSETRSLISNSVVEPAPETAPFAEQSVEQEAPSSHPSTDVENESAGTKPEYPQRWCPYWLRPFVLLGFGILFIVLAVVLSVLLGVSRRDDGLVETSENLVYLWRFGPTASNYRSKEGLYSDGFHVLTSY